MQTTPRAGIARHHHHHHLSALLLLLLLLRLLLVSCAGWGENDRGVSFTFGPDVVAAFLKRHDLDLICRAHQVVEDGYEFFAKRQLVTLFSAPNCEQRRTPRLVAPCRRRSRRTTTSATTTTTSSTVTTPTPCLLAARMPACLPADCGEFDNAGAMMSVDDTLMCSFQILKPAEKKSRFMPAGGAAPTVPAPVGGAVGARGPTGGAGAPGGAPGRR